MVDDKGVVEIGIAAYVMVAAYLVGETDCVGSKCGTEVEPRVIAEVQQDGVACPAE